VIGEEFRDTKTSRPRRYAEPPDEIGEDVGAFVPRLALTEAHHGADTPRSTATMSERHRILGTQVHDMIAAIRQDDGLRPLHVVPDELGNGEHPTHLQIRVRALVPADPLSLVGILVEEVRGRIAVLERNRREFGGNLASTSNTPAVPVKSSVDKQPIRRSQPCSPIRSAIS